jgi:heme oxygenase (biliverdin-producing, ferredoxin)
MAVQSSDNAAINGMMPASPPGSLTEMMRNATLRLHARAERSGIVNDILRGKASRYSYALLLRNLLPAYQTLEAGLEAHRRSSPVQAAACRELYRAAALSADLVQLSGSKWPSMLPLLAAGEKYAQHVAHASRDDGARLIAHAYTRYLGDLSGGRVLKQLLSRTLGLRSNELLFYDFPKINDADQFKMHYRRAIDYGASSMSDPSAVVAETIVAFELNIALSEAVQAAGAAAA